LFFQQITSYKNRLILLFYHILGDDAPLFTRRTTHAYRPCLPLTREVAAKQTEGETPALLATPTRDRTIPHAPAVRASL
ncbi:MAG: hypothetical protein IIW62_04730, partial [Selenomonadales bacterium]|nr:hypothetical protein [Selenomonadales bacterium]